MGLKPLNCDLTMRLLFEFRATTTDRGNRFDPLSNNLTRYLFFQTGWRFSR